MKKLLLFTHFIFLCALNLSAQTKYPVTKTVDSADTYFGKTYKDPYRWLENMKDPGVVNWFKQQADYGNDLLSKIPGRDSLIAEYKMLDKLQPAMINDMVYKGNRYFIGRGCRGSLSASYTIVREYRE